MDDKEVNNQKGKLKLPPLCQPKSHPFADDKKTQDLLMAYQIKSIKMALYPTEKYRLPPTSVSEYGWAWDVSSRKPFDQDLHSNSRPGMGTYAIDKFTHTGTHGRKNIHKWYGASPGACQKSWR